MQVGGFETRTVSLECLFVSLQNKYLFTGIGCLNDYLLILVEWFGVVLE